MIGVLGVECSLSVGDGGVDRVLTALAPSSRPHVFLSFFLHVQSNFHLRGQPRFTRTIAFGIAGKIKLSLAPWLHLSDSDIHCAHHALYNMQQLIMLRRIMISKCKM